MDRSDVEEFVEQLAFQDYRAADIEALYQKVTKKKIDGFVERLVPHYMMLRNLTGIHPTTGAKYDGFDLEFSYLAVNSEVELDDLSAYLDESNAMRNRYVTVVCPDSTRVKLSGAQDYIHANYVTPVDSSVPRYIVAQGPLPCTCSDFWQMIWENNVSCVVMLTQAMEKGRRKCDIYWPDFDEPIEIFGDLEIQELELEMDDHMYTRRFVLTHVRTGERRGVTHLQYMVWPDHGVPPNFDTFLDLVELADDYNTSDACIVVHCSAGVGRSGTFCLLHSQLASLRREIDDRAQSSTPSTKPLHVNLVSAILRYRQHRPGFVQTKSQLIYCYEALIFAVAREAERVAKQGNSSGAKLLANLASAPDGFNVSVSARRSVKM